MKTLYVARHATAETHSPTGTDFDRPLAARGELEIEAMAARTRDLALGLDLILASPAARTLATAAAYQRAFGLADAHFKTSRTIYSAESGHLVDVVQALPAGADRILVVTAVEAYIQFWVKLPGRILKALEAFGGLILGWITAAWNTVSGWVVTAFEDEVAFWTGLPDRILGALEGFGTKLLGWITDGWNMLTGFIVTAFEAEVTFWTGLPGKIVGALGDAGSTLLKWGGDLIGGLISGIGGAADSIGTAIWNAIKSGIHGIKGLVKGIPVIGGVLSDLIPFAAGGYVTKPTLGLIGEAGPEVVLPLNNPARMKQILGQAGQHGALSSLALSGSSSSHAANVTISPGAFVVHVHGAADPGVVGAATSAVNSGLSALTGALGRGRSPVRTGQR